MHIAIEEARNYEKIVFIKNILENGRWEEVTSHPTPLDPPLAISYENHQKSLAYSSYLAPLILFTLLKGKVKRAGVVLGAMPPL